MNTFLNPHNRLTRWLSNFYLYAFIVNVVAAVVFVIVVVVVVFVVVYNKAQVKINWLVIIVILLYQFKIIISSNLMSLKHLLYHKNMYFTYMHYKYYLCFSFILQLSLFQYFLADLILTFSCVSWFYCCCDPHGTLWRIWFNVFLCFNFVEKELNYVFFQWTIQEKKPVTR